MVTKEKEKNDRRYRQLRTNKKLAPNAIKKATPKKVVPAPIQKKQAAMTPLQRPPRRYSTQRKYLYDSPEK